MAHIELTSQVNTLQMHSQTLELNTAGELLFKTQTPEVLQTPQSQTQSPNRLVFSSIIKTTLIICKLLEIFCWCLLSVWLTPQHSCNYTSAVRTSVATVLSGI